MLAHHSFFWLNFLKMTRVRPFEEGASGPLPCMLPPSHSSSRKPIKPCVGKCVYPGANFHLVRARELEVQSQQQISKSADLPGLSQPAWRNTLPRTQCEQSSLVVSHEGYDWHLCGLSFPGSRWELRHFHLLVRGPSKGASCRMWHVVGLSQGAATEGSHWNSQHRPWAGYISK